MTDDLSHRTGLNPELLTLLRDHPRDKWLVHPNFAGLVEFWLDRHGMFRKLTDLMRTDAEAAVDGKLDPQQHRQRLSRFGSMLVQQLHGHHQIEDMHYFPALQALEQGLARGFDILDKDHHALDGLLAGFTSSANALLTGQGKAGAFHSELLSFRAMLDRHLADEEDLIVPVILKHGTAGLH